MSDIPPVVEGYHEGLQRGISPCTMIYLNGPVVEGYHEGLQRGISPCTMIYLNDQSHFSIGGGYISYTPPIGSVYIFPLAIGFGQSD